MTVKTLKPDVVWEIAQIRLPVAYCRVLQGILLQVTGQAADYMKFHFIKSISPKREPSVPQNDVLADGRL